MTIYPNNNELYVSYRYAVDLSLLNMYINKKNVYNKIIISQYDELAT